MRRLLILLVLVLASIAGPAFWLWHELATPFYGASDAETFVEVPKGATTRTIADLLTEAGVLNSRIPFVLYLRWTGKGRHLQAGEYRFAVPATPSQLAERLVHGDVFYRSITIPEGLTAQETLDLIVRSGLGNLEEMQRHLRRTEWISDLAPNARSLEGYLFPDTYRFSRKADSEQIVHGMVDRFRENFAKLLAEHPLQSNRPTSHIVTLASMVEKEAKTHEERLLVASVLSNRLEKGIPLACDPTVIYALKLAGKYDGNIRKSDLSMESSYNTYIHAGLPPGPISNPGMDSLLAAAAPPKSDYLYFVSRNDGTHQFSRDYQSHQNAVTRFQKHLTR